MRKTLDGRWGGIVGSWWKRPLQLDSPLALLVIPALGWSVAYLDRLGESLYYGIPAGFIDLSLSDALQRTGAVVVYCAILWAAVRAAIRWQEKAPVWKRGSIDQLGSTFIAVLSVAVFMKSLWVALVFAVIGAIALLIRFIGAWTLRGSSIQRQGVQSSRAPHILGMQVPQSVSMAVPAGLVLLFVILSLVLSFWGGNTSAMTRNTYLVTQSKPEMVLLATYAGNRGVLASRVDTGSALSNTRILIDLPDKEYAFLWRQLGTLYWPDGFAPLLSWYRDAMAAIGRAT